MKLAIILGTRPEIIKLSPVIRYLEREKLNYFIIHTNQHYDQKLDAIFFEELRLPKPKYNLNVGSGPQGKQTGKMLEKIEQILIDEKPNVVIVQGDTNTVLAGALAASKLHIKVAHVEAGLRSYDRNMPEEINRIIVDHISDFLFCPTEDEKNICLKEGIEKAKLFIVGNTIVDAIKQHLRYLNDSEILKKFNLQQKKYIYLTMHRPNNVDYAKNLKQIVDNLISLATKENIVYFFPIHPRTKNKLKEFNIDLPKKIFITSEPIGYLESLALIKNAKMIITDSGGIQEEAVTLKVPTLILRENTERPQILKIGLGKLVGQSKEKLFKEYNNLKKIKDFNYNNPLGDGNSSEKIINILKKYFEILPLKTK